MFLSYVYGWGYYTPLPQTQGLSGVLGGVGGLIATSLMFGLSHKVNLA